MTKQIWMKQFCQRTETYRAPCVAIAGKRKEWLIGMIQERYNRVRGLYCFARRREFVVVLLQLATEWATNARMTGRC